MILFIRVPPTFDDSLVATSFQCMASLTGLQYPPLAKQSNHRNIHSFTLMSPSVSETNSSMYLPRWISLRQVMLFTLPRCEIAPRNVLPTRWSVTCSLYTDPVLRKRVQTTHAIEWVFCEEHRRTRTMGVSEKRTHGEYVLFRLSPIPVSHED